jgi:hypothetical protein
MSPLAALLVASLSLAAYPAAADTLPPLSACSPVHCDVSAASTPEHTARLQTALGRLQALNPFLAKETSKVQVVLFPQYGILGGFFDPLHGIVAAREEG